MIARVTESGGPLSVSYESDVEPIFASKCTLCHYSGNATTVDLTQPFDAEFGIVDRETSRARAEARLIVDPSNPLNSFLLDKVIRTNLVPAIDGAAMPWRIPPLAPDKIAAIRQWISDGALDDERYASTIAPIFGDGKTLGGSCAHCHNPRSLFAPDLTRPFDPEIGIVNVAGSGNVLRVAPGLPDESGLVLRIEGNPAAGASMPFYPEALTTSEIDVVTSWVVAGAPQN